MRSTRALFDAHADALRQIDPSLGGLSPPERRLFAQTELCLAFLNDFVPGESVNCVPALMMGYPSLLDNAPETPRRAALMCVRHLCSNFGSKSAWVDALATYRAVPEFLRCFEIKGDFALPRAAVPQIVIEALHDQLRRPADWSERELRVAKPGDARIVVGKGQAQVAIRVPAVPSAKRAASLHKLKPRESNPAIEISFDQLQQAALAVDARESEPDWPTDSLPPIALSQRLRKLRPQNISGFFQNGRFRFDGATHVVGMLSSGKSTLVMSLLFALTQRSDPKRIAILVSDTMQGATLSARLRRHGIRATVLSSFYNRNAHLHSIYWQRSLQPTGWSIESLGDIADGFSTACPLDGGQDEPQLISGDLGGRAPYPSFQEKQCHRLYQSQPPEEVNADHGPDDVGPNSSATSCPLWPVCPAQKQQRESVGAQVLIMTPQAFVHMTPDKWTTSRHLTLPELIQYEFDLVIVDECDGVQKTLDDAFAPRSPIMGDEQDVYAPTIGQNSSQALRESSGVQFRKPVNAKWQSTFFTFFSLIGTIYAMLQNEQTALRKFYLNTPFTSGSILHALWRQAREAEEETAETPTLDDPDLSEEFLDVVRAAGSIRQYSNTASVSEDNESDRSETTFFDGRFEEAAKTLQDIARLILVEDYYEGLIPLIEAQLSGPMKPFHATSQDPKAPRSTRTTALALLLAVVTDLALAHYNWLVRTQPAVARDFKIDDGLMLGPASGLIRNYRTLLPANPAGAAFGLFYDEPSEEHGASKGGRLTLLSHLGVGRHLLTHLHNLLADEGQAGPHVLMLSGTSWAGGGLGGDTKAPTGTDCASPAFDVQVPVRGVLLQPDAELEAIRNSVFSLVRLMDEHGHQFGVSGQPQEQRRRNLAAIAAQLAKPIDGANRFERDWGKNGEKWGFDELRDRRRALLVTNSYADAAVVADALARSLETNGHDYWRVCCLVSDKADRGSYGNPALLRAKPLPRSLIERFGGEPEHTLIVAPIQIVARGHNILNQLGKAAISSIYFLHRVHPRPDDLGPIIARLNRYAQDCYDRGLAKSQVDEGLAVKAHRLRRQANHIVRYGLEVGRFGYRQLPRDLKAQFAWDMITPLWQTIGRGIRGGAPVYVGFIDKAFAPNSFASGSAADTPESSVLVQCVTQLRRALDAAENPGASDVARLLYEPFYTALAATEGLRHG